MGTVPILPRGAATSLWHVGCLQAAPHAAQLWRFADSERMQKGNAFSLLYEIEVMRVSFLWGKEKDGAVPHCVTVSGGRYLHGWVPTAGSSVCSCCWRAVLGLLSGAWKCCV